MTSDEQTAQRQVEAVKFVLAWLTEMTEDPFVKPDRRKAVRSAIRLIEMALENQTTPWTDTSE